MTQHLSNAALERIDAAAARVQEHYRDLQRLRKRANDAESAADEEQLELANAKRELDRIIDQVMKGEL